MFFRLKEIKRTNTLFSFPANKINLLEIEEIKNEHYVFSLKNPLTLYLFQADLNISNIYFLSICIFSGIFFVILFDLVFSLYFLPIFFLLGFFIPVSYCETKIRKRAANFNSDYPQFLMAMASSIKVGLTPYQAMEKATKLLSKDSLLKKEVEYLLKKIDSSLEKEKAIEEFASNIRLPDIKLFRSALSLVIENGGRFAPTLTRLANVSNNRSSLIRLAEVSTANMRMTANILLMISPVILLIISLNYENYWETLTSNRVANNLATAGSMIIIGCYMILRKMSYFKP